MPTLVVAGLLSLWPSLGRTEWPVAAQQKVHHINERVAKDDSTWSSIAQFIGWEDPYFRSVWDVVGTKIHVHVNEWTRIYRPRAMPASTSVEFGIPVTHYYFADPELHHEAPARILWRQENGHYVKAPLIIYNPGLFQGDSAPSTYYMMELLSHLGFHVLVISNPFSSDYVAHKPLAAVGSFMNEAMLLKEALTSFTQRNKSLISEVHAIGASYGAFLTSILAALDAEDQRVINGTVTLIGPQSDLYRSQVLLDRLIDESQSSFSARFFERAVGKHLYSGLVDAHTRALHTYAYFKERGFAERHYNDVAREIYDGLLDRKGKTGRVRAWKKSLRFRNSLETYTPENLSMYQGPTGKLSHWLERSRVAGQNQIRILTACDDFTTKCEWWDETLPQAWRDPKVFLMRRTGSHLGFVFTNWFDDFLHATYAPGFKGREVAPAPEFQFVDGEGGPRQREDDTISHCVPLFALSADAKTAEVNFAD